MIRVLKIIFVIFWMVLIFCFSLDNGEQSTKKSEGLIIQITKLFIKKDLSKEKQQELIEKYSVIVRKTAHFMIYFCLGFSVIILFQDFHALTLKDVLYTTIVVFIYACTDEIHQSFIPGRSAQFTDVLIDTLGSICASFLWYFIK